LIIRSMLCTQFWRAYSYAVGILSSVCRLSIHLSVTDALWINLSHRGRLFAWISSSMLSVYKISGMQCKGNILKFWVEYIDGGKNVHFFQWKLAISCPFRWHQNHRLWMTMKISNATGTVYAVLFLL